MKRSSLHLFALILLIFTAGQIKATHVMGADITYKWVDTLTYDFFLTFYRDCRGVPMSNPSGQTTLRCLNGTVSYTVNLQLKSISEITEVCANARQCIPANTYGTGEGVEAHVYFGRIDFRKAPYDKLLSCGPVVIETGQCCRSGAINTAPNGNFFTFAMIDLSKAPVNSSPDLNRPYNPYILCNQPWYYNLLATEKDGDSLSYSLECALTAYKTCTQYSGVYSEKMPIQPYWAYPYKYPHVDENATPPMGIYLDQENGDFIVTPVKCDEVSTLIIEIKEWRKSKCGVMEHIGTVRRDGMTIVSTVSNNIPVLPRKKPYALFAGDTLNISIVPMDKDSKDSVGLILLDTVSGARNEIKKGKIQSFEFSWSPDSTFVNDKPYQFTLNARDNSCPKLGKAYQQYLIYVAKRIPAYLKTTQQNCLQYQSNLFVDSMLSMEIDACTWTVLDSSGNPINDQRVWFTKSRNRTGAGYLSDLFELPVAGTYVVKVEMRHHRRFIQFFFDTITVTQNNSGWFAKNILAVCPGNAVSLTPDSMDLDPYFNFTWDEKNFNNYAEAMIDYKQLPYLGKVYRLKGQDSAGCFRVDEILAVPASVLAIALTPTDTIVCEGSTYQLLAEVSNHHPLVWDTAYWSAGTAGLITTLDTTGVFIFTARNECASYKDTIVVDEIPLPKVKLPEDRDLCFGDSLLLDATFKDATYSWSNNTTTETIKIDLPGVYSVEVTTFCGVAHDTVVIHKFVFNTPSVELGGDTILCITDSLMLDAGTGEVTYLWNSSDTSRKILVTQSGLYKVAVNNVCGTSYDSISVSFDPLLKQNMGPDIETNNPVGHILDAGNPGASYQWFDGDTNRTYTTKTFGKFWVKVSNACGEVSDTITLIEKIGIEMIESDGINIYPNPGKGILNIRGDDLGNPVFEVFDVNGKFIPVRQETIQSGRNYRITVDAATGVYTLIWLKGETRHKKVFMIE